MITDLTPTAEAELHLLSLSLRGDGLSDAVACGVTDADFLDYRNAVMWRAILATEKEEGSIVARNVRVRMGEHAAHYDWVKDNGAVARNTKSYAVAVMKFAKLREVHSRIRLLTSTIEATDVNEDLDRHIAITTEIGLLLTEERETKGAKLVSDILNDELFPELERRRVEYERDRSLPGCPTGITILDKYLVGGFKPGGMYTVAARTGVGKTTLGVNFAYQAARVGKSAVFFTVEMERREIAAKFLSMASGVRQNLIEVGNVSKETGTHLENTKIGFAQLPLYVDDTFCGGMEVMAATCRRMKRQGKIDLAIVDYLQLLSLGTKWKPEYERITEVSTFIKRLALELRIPIVCMAQLNRAAAQEAEPDMHHLKGSGQIEQDSNAVIIVFKDGKGELEQTFLKVTKNRAGQTSDRLLMSIDFGTGKVNDIALNVPHEVAYGR